MSTKKIIAALFAWAVLASPIQAKTVIDTRPVVQVVCDGVRGSAVRVGPGEFITAAHVANSSGCKVEGEGIRDVRDYGSDFATFKGPDGDRAKITCRGYSPDEEYVGVGYGGGWPQQMFQPVRASRFQNPKEKFQMFTGEFIPGMSGGAVYNDRGRVVGIIDMRWPARSLALKETPLCR